MASSVAISRPGSLAPGTAKARSERSIRRRVAVVWGLLIVNILTYFNATWSGQPLIIPIPSVIGKLVTQGALPAALLVALTVNRRILIRPNAFLCILSLMALEAFMVALEPGHIGTLYRTFRFAGFVATLWLITPWFGRRDLLLVRAYVLAMSAVLVTVLLGLFADPGTALAQGRLEGALWPYPPTQVAHFGAVTVGLVLVLWFCGLMRGRVTLAVVVVGVTIVLLTHTRTALVALLAGLIVGGLSLFRAKARVRKLFAIGATLASVAVITLSGVLTTWLSRGESSQQLTSLTGRTTVWGAVLSAPRNELQRLFGFGLSNLSFNGLPIDSNWLGTYLDLGLLGVLLSAAMLLFVLINAYFQPIGPQRALALFLVTYCLISTFTETGLSDPSLYLLDLTLAASLLVRTRHRRPA